MDFDSLNEIQHNEAVRKRLAKLMAHDCFRNTKLEDFHSGRPVRVLQFGYRKYLPSSPILPGPFNTQMPAELPGTANDSEPSPTVISPPVTASR